MTHVVYILHVYPRNVNVLNGFALYHNSIKSRHGKICFQLVSMLFPLSFVTRFVASATVNIFVMAGLSRHHICNDDL